MKKFLLAPFLAALAMFFWGFIYWGLPPHLAYKALGAVADDSKTALEVGKLFPASGSYVIPNPLLGEEKMIELAKRGPMVEVHVHKESMPAMDPGVMIKGFIHVFVLALMLTFMLVGLEKSFQRWTCRVKFCLGVGLLFGVCELSDAIWWHHAWSWTLARALYTLVEFTVAGLVLAKFVTPKPVTAAA